MDLTPLISDMFKKYVTGEPVAGVFYHLGTLEERILNPASGKVGVTAKHGCECSYQEIVFYMRSIIHVELGKVVIEPPSHLPMAILMDLYI